MMRFIALIAALASTASAASSTKRMENFAEAFVYAFNTQETGYKSFEVPLGKLTHFEDVQITRLEMRGISFNVPGTTPPNPDDITCQMYKDQYGVQPGSAAFTKAKPALLSTNPVELGWILCYVDVEPA